jgi:hypothetical protein
MVRFEDQCPQVARIERQCLFSCRERGCLVVEATASRTKGCVNSGIGPARGHDPFERLARFVRIALVQRLEADLGDCAGIESRRGHEQERFSFLAAKLRHLSPDRVQE